MTIRTAFKSMSVAELTRKLASAETASLLLALVEMTGDTAPLDRWGKWIQGPTPINAEFPTAEAEEIRAQVADLLIERGAQTERLSEDSERFRALTAAATDRVIPDAEKPLVLKEMGLLDEAFVDWSAVRPDRADQFPVVIIGAGMSGIATAIHLERMGIPFVVLDKNDEVGGTWLVNTYPGCGVDIASHYFSFSFAPKSDWSRYYAKQPEILAYLKDIVRTFGIGEKIEFRTTVQSVSYEEATQEWVLEIRTGDGPARTMRAKVVVSGVGALSTPSVPELPGRGEFRGKVCHSAEWDPTIDVTGKKVVLVGNGASANQIGPAIAPDVERLTVLQRSPQWVNGVTGYLDSVPEDEKWVLSNIPAYERWFRVRTMLSMNDVMRPAATVDKNWDGPEGTINEANEKLRERLIGYMRSELGERQDLLDQMVPDFPPMMKRMLRDNGWCRMFRRPTVELVTGAASRFTENGIVDEHGREHEADIIIFATGFTAARMLSSYEVVGRDGVSIRDVWGEEDPRAYLGLTVTGFPNLFILYGPNTNIGVGGSIFFQAEAQSTCIARLIRDMIERGASSAEVRQDVFEDYNRRLDQEMETLIWSLPVGTTWYRNSKGRVTANMPWTSADYWNMTRSTSLDDFVVRYHDDERGTAHADDIYRELDSDVARTH
ncbi:NAD(P)-binding domain-containing protein [Rhodococcus sp. NPDC059968]|uniref:flavin-containing monooxygenase n=1 Tax=Rhodococcus sp. NPDC059968 TaxID=3347017 RepID=UPI00366EE1BC